MNLFQYSYLIQLISILAVYLLLDKKPIHYRFFCYSLALKIKRILKIK